MKKYLKRIVVFTLSSFMAFAAACGDNPDPIETTEQKGLKDTDIVLVSGGQSNYTVVVPTESTAAEDYAADMLITQFERATGVSLSVREDNGQKLDANQKVISIGRTSILQDSGLEVKESELTCDGYKLKRYGETVVLCGAEDSGTIYSVIDFLHYQFNYEVYAADEVYIEEVESAFVKDYSITEIPDFWGRDMDGYFDKYPEAALGMKMRTLKMNNESYGYGSSQDWIGGHCESWKNILPESKYNDPSIPETYHPEWYSARQICLTNEELIAEFIKNVKALILENPNARIVNIAEQDHGGIATCCDACKKEASKYGLSGHVIRFCNKIITAVEKWLDDEGIDRNLEYTTFAYSSGTWTPPVDGQADGTYKIKDESCRPHEQLYIRLAPLWLFCYQHEFEDEKCNLNQSWQTIVDGWRSITDRFYVWDYSADYSAYLAYYNVFGTLQNNMRYWKEIGVTNIFREDTTGEAHNSFSQLRAYLTAKLMWDVDIDVDAATNDFFDKYYKTGASAMMKYYDLMRSHCALMDAQTIKGQHAVNYFPLDAAQWPISVLENALALIDEAAATYEPLKVTNPDLYNMMYLRTLQESVNVRYMILVNYASYYNINSSKYKDMLDQLEIDAALVGVKFCSEGTYLSSWISNQKAGI